LAEFLFRGKNNGTTPAHWRRGDLVVIREDGHTWGTLETKAAWVAAGHPAADWPGDFYLLKVPGLSVARAERFIEAWIDNNNDPGGLGARAVWRVLISEIPTSIRNILLNTGQLTVGVDVTRAQIEARFRRKDTEATADLT
jgi:hypothetical protein